MSITNVCIITGSSSGLGLLTAKKTEDFGSECEVFAATSGTLNGKTGVFMSDMKEARSSEESYDLEKAKRLWDLSEQLTHQNI
ncbi:unnamed protein product [Rotaria sp. Silwood1]|nr:unnamed protein product [Rotaria sp. Silwood1]